MMNIQKLSYVCAAALLACAVGSSLSDYFSSSSAETTKTNFKQASASATDRIIGFEGDCGALLVNRYDSVILVPKGCTLQGIDYK
jgi:hypothetical protein